MPTTDLNLSELDTLLTKLAAQTWALSPETLAEVNSYLTNIHLTNNIVTQDSTSTDLTQDFPPFVPDANGNLPQALATIGASATIDTSKLGDPNLQALFLLNGNNYTVTGNHGLLIAYADNHPTNLTLNDTSNDTILTGVNTLGFVGSHYQLGGGADTLVDRGTGDVITGGTGNNQLVIADGTNTTITEGTGDHNTIVTTAGAETLQNLGNTAHTTTTVYSLGAVQSSAEIEVAKAASIVNIFTQPGGTSPNFTAVDSVFLPYASTDVVSETVKGNQTNYVFNSGQHVSVAGQANVNFTDESMGINAGQVLTHTEINMALALAQHLHG
jgi:hypothetical protein